MAESLNWTETWRLAHNYAAGAQAVLDLLPALDQAKNLEAYLQEAEPAATALNAKIEAGHVELDGIQASIDGLEAVYKAKLAEVDSMVAERRRVAEETLARETVALDGFYADRKERLNRETVALREELEELRREKGQLLADVDARRGELKVVQRQADELAASLQRRA